MSSTHVYPFAVQDNALAADLPMVQRGFLAHRPPLEVEGSHSVDQRIRWEVR